MAKYEVKQTAVSQILADVRSDKIAIPEFIREVSAENYDQFLQERHRLMADMIRQYYEGL